jgi:hypothetical protein
MKSGVEDMPRPTDKASFGQNVLGPIFADFSMRLWTLLSNIERPMDTTVLFCARGGLRLKLIYDRFLQATGLASPIVTHNLMVSRIVAVRAALLVNRPSAFEQIGYEMGASSLRDVVRAISGTDPVATDAAAWDHAYTQKGLTQLLSSEEGLAVRASIQQQADYFMEHLLSCTGGRGRAILCDSGLVGSTMQLLEDGISDIKWGCVLFARANYKKFAAPHFARTTGLAVEADCYSPLNARTAVLRYWQLIESTLEPALKSVSMFERIDNTVRANLETEAWQNRIAPQPDEFLAGVLAYIDQLSGSGAATRIMKDVGPSYAELRRAIVWPTHHDVEILDIGRRSVDFGRTGNISVLTDKPGILGALRGSLWREGAVAAASSPLRLPVLAGLEAAYAARWAARSLKRLSR